MCGCTALSIYRKGEYVFASDNPFHGDPQAFAKGKDLFRWVIEPSRQAAGLTFITESQNGGTTAALFFQASCKPL